MEYKLVAIDMDGTLLNSKKEISKRTRMSIKKAEEQGVYVVIATGRILKSVLNYSDALRLKSPLIACNGAIILDEFRNVISESALEKRKIRDVIHLAKEKNIYFHFYGKTSLYSDIKSEEVLSFYDEGNKTSNIDVNIYSDLEEIIGMEDFNAYKFIFIDDNRRKLEALRKSIDDLGDISTTSSWINNIEAMKYNVSKGEALRKLCGKLNINQEEVIAIGDSENDLSMLEFAGLPAVMKNGCEEIKKQFQYITDSNDQDGVAKVIEKFILK